MTIIKMNNSPAWDKANSSFLRVIYLQNGNRLTGYSKKVGRNERTDKVDLITNWILRDLSGGYLDIRNTNPRITPIAKIEYYRKKADEIEPVINLYYQFPEWINSKWLEDKKFFIFISRLYDMLDKQRSVSEIINALQIKSRSAISDPLDLSTKRFSNIRDLNAYVYRLKEDPQLSHEAIEHFYRSYLEKYSN